uniref:Uncharacterized protein n=1 Tax=Marseillevirus LCMAC102 TaxID=2506603 RepID=A0A481YUN0_9VIRU|nr:MAG: hypothetical protein LCMAC102_00280 [Marseillevirus LCMAC102]
MSFIYVVYDVGESVVVGCFDSFLKAHEFAKQEFEPDDVMIYCEKLNVPHPIGVDNKNVMNL